jgi:hypothetical protein
MDLHESARDRGRGANGHNVTVDMTTSLDPFRFVLIAVSGWVNRQQLELINYLREENRVLREQLGGKRLRFNDDQRRRLAAKAKRLGRKLLQEVATIVTPETLLGWHRRLIRRGNTTAAASGDAADRGNPRRSRIWWCEWQKKTAVGAIGESRERCPIWVIRWVVARSPRC